jgi:penicillin-binding protein 1A
MAMLWDRLGSNMRREDTSSWAERASYEEAPYSPLYGIDDDEPEWRTRPAEPAPEWTPEPAGRTRWWWIRKALLALLILFLLLVGWLAITAPLSKSLQPIAPPRLTLLAADGTPIARNGANVDRPVEVAALPPHVVEAFLAIEDRRFYSHWGIDPRGIARAVWGNLTTGRTQGGSTITQQLAKFTFLTSDQNLTRKAREALIAVWLEAWLSKDEILERYLSNAYFGDNTYGLRAASLHYFYRQPERLRPEQAAMLAGLLQAPSRYAPTRNYDLAEKRMRTVIGAMVDAGYVTEGEARAMRSPRLDVRSADDLPTGTYFADWALPQARRMLGTGYSHQTMTTTLDSRLQKAAWRAIGRAGLGGAQVALVAMRSNGEVVAMVGGRDYSASPFNRATQARRQPGSTFKLFVYLAALEDGWDPDDVIDNSAITEGSYRPRNSGERYSETITLEDAFARSSNVAAVRLLNEVGHEAVVDMARSLGVTSPLPEGDSSMALGTSTMTLLELTSAYAGVAANSFPVQPRAFQMAEQGWLARLWDGKDSLSGSNHRAIEQMLRAAVNRGTGRAAMLSVPNFGKTGTTQDNRDALFVGYSGDLVVGVWVGNDDNSPLKGISGGTVPARIWRDFMREALGVPAAARSPRTVPAPDPSGEVQPLDLPEIPEVPHGEGDTRLRIEDGAAVFGTEIDGAPVELRVDQNGLRLDAEELRRRAADEAAQRLREAREQARDRQAEARQTFEEQMRERVDAQGDLVEGPP